MSIIKRFRVLVAALLIAGAAGVCALPEAANAQSTAATAGNASADSASAPVAPPAPSAKATEVVENPYGLDALWKTGDFVAKGTLVILVIMSMGTWYILVVKLVEQTVQAVQGSEEDILDGGHASGRREHACRGQRLPLHCRACAGCRATPRRLAT
jgi:biopolymer transport protein ExbB